MDAKQQKPSSIFASINPAPAPAPAPAPSQPARPAVSEETVNLLKQKIDALERNIISQLDKRLTEQAKAAAERPAPPPPVSAPPSYAPPPPPPRQQAVEAAFLMKMTELERRMEEFGRMAMMSASQMKNIEESKISARREIEDLLKAVREQQKYSELDRQMHDQLEKSWTRVEELEKKLMGFYSVLLDSQQKRTEEDSRLSAGLAERLGAIETRLAGQESAVAGVAPALEKSLEDRLARLEVRLAAAASGGDLKRSISEELGRQSARNEELLRSQAQAQRAVFEELVREKIGGLSDAFASHLSAQAKALETQLTAHRAALETQFSTYRSVLEGELSSQRRAMEAEAAERRRSSDAAVSALREEFLRQARELGAQIEAFRGTAEANRLRAEGVEESLDRNAREISSSLQLYLKSSEEAARAQADAFVSRLETAHRRQLEELNTRYADAFRGFAVVDQARILSGAVLARLADLEPRLSSALASVDADRLALAPGVSGIVMRRGVDELREIAAGLKADLEPLKALNNYAEKAADGL